MWLAPIVFSMLTVLLLRFETIKRVHLSMKPFSIDTNTLTPTMKIRRKEAYYFHKAAIDALYALGEPSKL